MEFRILGPLEVLQGGHSVELGGAKQRALLALLTVHANEIVRTERLIDELWRESPPGSAAKAVQVNVSRLRRVLGEGRGGGGADAIVTRDHGYELRTDPESIDARRFERLAAEGKASLAGGQPERARELLDRALALWRGSPLDELSHEPFAQPEIGRLEELRSAAGEDLIDAKLALGQDAELVGELEALIATHPYRERLRAQLMLALYRAERQADALQAYQDARRRLVDDLGIEPGARLRELEHAILAQDPALAFIPRSPVAPSATSPASRTGFVGRARELEELARGLDDACAGRGRLFLLVGEPGIGKSRLAEELMAQAAGRAAQVCVGRCWEAGGAPAYWPWVQSLRASIRGTRHDDLRDQLGEGAADLAQLLPELRELFADLPEPPQVQSEGARFRLFEATAEFLRRASVDRPLVLVLDDLHAADAPSLLLLRFLAREIGSARVLLVGAFRDVDPLPGRPLTEMLAEVTREPVTRRLTLGGLSQAEVGEYLELTASDIASADVATALHDETEGNPLFVGEIVRLLSVEGRVEAGGRAAIAIPQSVRDVIARRLTHLSDQCNRLLVSASVLGRDFDLAPLALMSGLREEELLDALDEALTARVVGDLPGAAFGSMRFAHVLIRDVLYEQLTTPRRVRLHARALEALERVHGDDAGPRLAELAHHAIAARDADKGVGYARRAGDRALALVAYEEAARLYETALDALEMSPADEAIRCDLLLSLGDAHSRGGDLGLAKETFARAADIARALDDADRLASAAIGYGGRFVWFRAGNDRLLIPLIEDALERFPADHPSRARLLARLAGALRDRPVPERRESLSREAVEVARRLGDGPTLAYALEGTYSALSWPRDTDRWRRMAAELIQLAREEGNREQEFFGRLHAWGASMVCGDLPAADAQLALMKTLAEELRQPAQLLSVAVIEGTRACLAGRFDEASQLMSWTRELGVRYPAWGIDETTFNYLTHFQSWGLRRECGGLEEIREPLEQFVAEYPSFFIFRCLLASLYSQIGCETEARAELQRLAADEFAALEVGTEWFFGASLLAEVCASLDAADAASDLYEALLPYGDYNVIAQPEFCLGSAWRYLGLLASAMHRWVDAARHFEAALEMNSRMGARPWIAHTQDDYARMLLDRGGSGDGDRAASLLGEAVSTYQELGMQTWAERASGVGGIG